MASMITQEIILDFYDALSRHDMDALEKALWEDAQLLFPKTQPLKGRDKVLKFFKILFRQYPELTFQVQGVILQGNSAAVHWSNRGRTRKDEPYSNEGVTLVEFEDGRVRFLNDFFKDTAVF